MGKYLRAAFFIAPPMPGMGNVPINVIAVAALIGLGFIHPLWWWIGAVLETIFLVSLATNPRFQHLADAMRKTALRDGSPKRRQALYQQLPQAYRYRLDLLEKKCTRILDAYRTVAADDLLLDANRTALDKFRWTFLRLLAARAYLNATAGQATMQDLDNSVAALEQELSEADLSETLRASKQTTLELTRKRRENMRQRLQTMDEIGSDLARIEAQIDLALENVLMQGQPQVITLHLDLATRMLDSSIFGPAAAELNDPDTLDSSRDISPPPPQAQ